MPILLYAKPPLIIPTSASRYCFAGARLKWVADIPEVCDLPNRLERCFDKVRDAWWKIGKEMAKMPNGNLAHMPTCSTYASDFGQVAAWSLLTRELAKESKTTIVICSDPWLFRDIKDACTVCTHAPPILFPTLGLLFRGFLARVYLVAKVAWKHLLAIRTRKYHKNVSKVIMVYAHPESCANGLDAYFGDLMLKNSHLFRLIHTDGDIRHSLSLAADKRTASLHAWGRLSWLPRLLFARWKLSKPNKKDLFAWLIMRAVVLEASGASAAINLWQMLCQSAWLDEVSPQTVIWPWENHPWERDFVQKAKKHGTLSVGYQHSVVGRHMYNQSPKSNIDGLSGLPDQLLANGPLYRDDLNAWGVPETRLSIAGAYRQRIRKKSNFDPSGPIFVGLSNNPLFSTQMLDAIKICATKGLGPFLLKEHPMYPYSIKNSEGVKITDKHFTEHARISALIYCTGTIGLEGILNSIPTFRFQPSGYVALDILPKGMGVINVNTSNLLIALKSSPKQPSHDPRSIFAPIQNQIWKKFLTHKK